MIPVLKTIDRLVFCLEIKEKKDKIVLIETLTEHFSKPKSTPQTTIYLYYHYEMITMLMLLAIKNTLL